MKLLLFSQYTSIVFHIQKTYNNYSIFQNMFFFSKKKMLTNYSQVAYFSTNDKQLSQNVGVQFHGTLLFYPSTLHTQLLYRYYLYNNMQVICQIKHDKKYKHTKKGKQTKHKKATHKKHFISNQNNIKVKLFSEKDVHILYNKRKDKT